MPIAAIQGASQPAAAALGSSSSRQLACVEALRVCGLGWVLKIPGPLPNWLPVAVPPLPCCAAGAGVACHARGDCALHQALPGSHPAAALPGQGAKALVGRGQCPPTYKWEPNAHNGVRAAYAASMLRMLSTLRPTAGAGEHADQADHEPGVLRRRRAQEDCNRWVFLPLIFRDFLQYSFFVGFAWSTGRCPQDMGAGRGRYECWRGTGWVWAARPAGAPPPTP